MSDVKITVGIDGAEAAAKSLAEVRQAASGTASETDAAKQPVDRLSDAMAQLKAQCKDTAGKAKEAGAGIDDIGRGAMGAGHLLHGLERASDGSARGMFAAASGARHLMDAMGMGALGPVALILGGITAGVMALFRAFGDTEEKTKQLAAQTKKVEEQIERWRALHLDDIEKAYSRIRSEIDATLRASELLYASQLKLMDARSAGKIAEVDADEQEALSKLAPGDALGRKQVTKEYAERRAQIQEQNETDKAFLAISQARKSQAAAEEKRDTTNNRAQGVLESFEHNKGRIEALNEEDLDIGFKLTELFLNGEQRKHLEKRRDQIAHEIERIQDRQEALVDKYDEMYDRNIEETAAAEAAATNVLTAEQEFANKRKKQTGTELKGRNEDRENAGDEARQAASRESEMERERVQRELRQLEDERVANTQADQDARLEQQRRADDARKERERIRRENETRRRSKQPLLAMPGEDLAEENIDATAAREGRDRDLDSRRRSLEDRLREIEQGDRERRRQYEGWGAGAHTSGPLEEAHGAAAPAATGPKAASINWNPNGQDAGDVQHRVDQSTQALVGLHKQLDAALTRQNDALAEQLQALIRKIESNAEKLRQTPRG